MFSKEIDPKISSNIDLYGAVKFIESYRAEHGQLLWKFSIRPHGGNLKGVCLTVDYKGLWYKEYCFDTTYMSKVPFK